jgi:hypothetical protein
MDFRYDTSCGLYCGACDVLQANKSGTVETLAQAWGMEPDQLSGTDGLTIHEIHYTILPIAQGLGSFAPAGEVRLWLICSRKHTIAPSRYCSAVPHPLGSGRRD